ncbi:MAG TPA: hypothetical protein VMW62_09975 [Chloroflexota bacterium]|nr:hypothetical protein [Chloroflexota bacterium]
MSALGESQCRYTARRETPARPATAPMVRALNPSSSNSSHAARKMPLSGSGVTAADRVVLVLMHLTVAAFVLPVLYTTSPRVERPAAHDRMALGEAA